eukprot:GILJ01005948.1.p1 GENE.GILJ01005948.1~~GILJ01005948.1.p1  ORF type:complete len:125 (-),score=1.19 GILJ01005948.1:330-704(-)
MFSRALGLCGVLTITLLVDLREAAASTFGVSYAYYARYRGTGCDLCLTSSMSPQPVNNASKPYVDRCQMKYTVTSLDEGASSVFVYFSRRACSQSSSSSMVFLLWCMPCRANSSSLQPASKNNI